MTVGVFLLTSQAHKLCVYINVHVLKQATGLVFDTV